MLKLGTTTINKLYLGANNLGAINLGNGPIFDVSFTPGLISGLKLWLDASDTATITPGATFTWADKSGQGNNATQGTAASQPTSGTRTLNSLNVLDFDGSNDRLVLPSGLYPLPQGDNTVFIVCMTDNAAKSAQLPISGMSSTNHRYRISYAGGTTFGVLNGTVETTAAYTINTSPHILAMLRSNASVYGTIDGTAIASTTVNGASNSINSLAIGAFGTSNTSGNFDGIIAEIVIYDRDLSASEANQVQTYLATKWNITISPIAWPGSIAGFGDSITAGSEATTAADRWLNIVAATTSSSILNQGISGTVLQNSIGLANNGRDRYAAALTGVNKQDKVYILYGLNDLRYTAAPASMNLSNFTAQYQQIITGLLAAGYTVDDIYLGSPTWIPVAGYSVGTAPFTGSSEAVNLTYGAAVRALAVSNNVYYAPVHEDMLAYPGGPALLIDPDDIHPNDLGHGVIATSFINATKVT